MKLDAEITDGFLIQAADGTTSNARVAVIRYQKRPRAPWLKVNVIVDSEDVPTVLRAAAAHIESGDK